MKNLKKMQKYVEEEQSILWTVALRANKINRNEFIELKSMSYLVAYCVLCKKRDCYGFTATILLFQSQKLLGFDEETSMYYTTTHSQQHWTHTTTSIYYTTVFSDDFQGYEVMENAFLLKEQPHVLMHSIALSVSSFIRFKVF